MFCKKKKEQMYNVYIHLKHKKTENVAVYPWPNEVNYKGYLVLKELYEDFFKDSHEVLLIWQEV